MNKGIDPGLLEFAETDVEIRNIKAVIDLGSQRKAAADLGISHQALGESIRKVKARAAKKNFTTEFGSDRLTREGFSVTKTAQMRNRDGDIVVDWTSSSPDKEKQFDMIKEVAVALAEPIRGMAKPIAAPTNTSSELMACYPIPEPHMGLYSWKTETGADYDTDIAEAILLNSMTELVESAPNSDKALIVNLGDYFHLDDESNQTKQSGNALDVDGRWSRVFKIGVKVHREMINLALKKHDHVTVKSGLGNHDKQSIYCLMSMMDAYFENEPRVHIELPINPFAYHTFGKNLIGIHHGNGVKPDKMPLVMATDMPKEWGNSIFRTMLMGHIHHRTVKEHPGCTVESFRSVAAKDSWHNGAGYRAGRGMECIIYHKDGGEHGRRIVNIAQGG